MEITYTQQGERKKRNCKQLYNSIRLRELIAPFNLYSHLPTLEHKKTALCG